MSGSLNSPEAPFPGSTKTELRKHFLAERRALSLAEVNRRSQLITGHFFSYFTAAGLADTPGMVHTFLPIRRQNEVDTWPILHGLWAQFGQTGTVVPVTNFQTGQLRHIRIYSDTPLVDNAFGIPEPALTNQPEVLTEHLKAVLIPLLAFDRQGNRIGYGGGFYDRFLAQCLPDCQKIGLSLFEPVEQISGVSEIDVILNGCITPTKVHSFGG